MAQALERLAVAEQRLAELEQKPAALPSFGKANTPERERKARQKRNPEHNRARRVEPPTRVEQHALERCPDCGLKLRGMSIGRRRQVIELPPPPPVEVIEHQVIKRWCPRCGRWHEPHLDLRGQVLGQGRVGLRIASLLAYLRTTLRLPIRRIGVYLRTLHNLTLSNGEIVELLHQVRRATQAAVDQLKAHARASPVLHADETGWREAGHNGFIWACRTPGEDAVRYYEYDSRRAGAVVKRLLGGRFQGHLVSDFYGGYNIYAGKHQRCWVHLQRDLHSLKTEHRAEATVQVWATAVRALYDKAQAFLHSAEVLNQEQREMRYAMLVEHVHVLGLQYAQAKRPPCQALAKRRLRHQDELFQFVLVDGLSADNNLAERSIRPVVVIRKISGGSQSAEGSKTRLALASLVETWQARGLNPFEECLKLLRQTPLPQI